MTVTAAVLDADVLVPILSCDLLLSFFDLALYRPVVPETVLVEVERNLLADFPHLDPDAVRRRVARMRVALGANVVSDGDVAGIAVSRVNAKDRHIFAAALAHDASLVVSNDRRLRDQINADIGDGVEAITADEFGCRLHVADPVMVGVAIDIMVAKRTRPPVTRDVFIAQIARAWPTFAFRSQVEPQA